MDVEIGQLLDNKYKIVRLLGEGGMGAVYEGENVRIHHRVAIKVMHPTVEADNGARERFEREAQAAGRIGSEHIVEVFDLGELPNGARYMVMEFLAGEPLSSRVLKLGRVPVEGMAPLMLQLLDGLGAAHAAGIIHRDLKPDNVFLQRTKGGGDFVKIVDFGVSKFNALSGGSGMSMTRTGAVVGTPYYMSPEQVRGAKLVDHRSDLYSVGVVLFECITGGLPFEAETFNELMFKIALEQPRDPEQLVPGLDPRFARIVRKAMAREPADRYATAQEFAQAIDDWMRLANVAPLPGAAAGSMAAVAPLPVSSGSASSSSAGGGPAQGAPPASGPEPADARQPALQKTTGAASLSTSTTAAPRRPIGAIVAAAGAAIVVAAGIGVTQMSRGKAPAPEAPPQHAAAQPAPPPPPETAPATAAAPAAASLEPAPAPAAPATTPSAAPSSEPPPRAAPAHPARPAVAAGKRPAAAAQAQAAAPAATSSDEIKLKGRTIRTEL